MTKNQKTGRPKITVVGGGTGLPVLLRSLKDQDADVTAIVTVADDGGSSGLLREAFNAVPPGDLRNVMVALSDLTDVQKEIFQYRFRSDIKILGNHSLGNLIIAAMAEQSGNIYKAIQLLSHMMNIKGHVYPAAEEPVVLHAKFADGSSLSGESKISKARKEIKQVSVSSAEPDHPLRAGKKVISSIMEADMVVLGPGSLYTSILPNLMIPDIGKAIMETPAKVTYICNIMTQAGETENFTDADHVRVLHEHLGARFVDIVLTNNGKVPEEYVLEDNQKEYLVQVKHDFKGMKEKVPYVISDDFLLLDKEGVYHNGQKVAEELFKKAFELKRMPSIDSPPQPKTEKE